MEDQATRRVISDNGLKRGALTEAQRVFAAFGLNISDEAARKARSRSRGER
ncbi:MAG TPA: hypothetical protein QF604_17080 [Candidatus Latescibacteria bacterium]|jgi:hypothetical protein|nr:hypothetical protein [Candidatus Latescibacterota bacterium]|tara:strand:- start:1038 stop:1190 length:153 start_codon:yes stop_codon:yes gene_type:complete